MRNISSDFRTVKLILKILDAPVVYPERKVLVGVDDSGPAERRQST